jgi:hypothetical protein
VDAQDPAASPGPSQVARPGNLWLAVVAAALLEILVLGGGGVAGYALRSSTYSPERAVTDYFAAQSRGDVSGMMANATFLQGSNPEFFRQAGIASMMDLAQNKDVRNVKLVSSHAIDATTQAVAVSMTWAGTQRSHTYTVQKDNSEFRDLIYRSWRIMIPFVTIDITLPNQPGPIQVDGITPAASNVSTIQAVEGYHSITMNANAFYDRTTEVADGVDGTPAATFAPAVSSGAVALAVAAVKLAFPNCDALASPGCLNHQYNAPNDGQRWFFPLPGYGDVFYTTYLVTLVGDPTSDLKLVVSPDAGKVNASGTCTVTVTVNGNQTYNLAGPWTATLRLESGRFTADLVSNCWATKA